MWFSMLILDNVFLGIMLITVCNLGLCSVFVVPCFLDVGLRKYTVFLHLIF